MTFRFDPARRLVLVEARIQGPTGESVLDLAVDTGASLTLISPASLALVGCEIDPRAPRLAIMTGSRSESVPRVVLPRLTALGRSLSNLSVLAHELPSAASVHGLLGLDFFAGCRLELDFRAGTIRLEPPDA